MSGLASKATGLPAPVRRARLLKVALGLLVTVALIVIPLAMPGTLGRFTASVTNSTNTGKVMPFFSCRLALTEETGRVFAYQMNATKPVNLVDNSANSTASSNVSVTNQPTGCTHDTSGSLKFTGSTSNVSLVRYTTTVTPPQTFTQELWFQTSGGQGNLMSLTNNAAYAQETKFDREIYIGPAGRLSMTNYIPLTGGFEQLRTPNVVSDGAWHHMIATRDAAGGTASLYVDGVLAGTQSLAGTLDTFPSATWRLGCARSDTWPNAPAKANECFNGNIGFAAVYNRSFTRQDVLNHYKAGNWAAK